MWNKQRSAIGLSSGLASLSSFFILAAVLARLQNNNISGLLNPKHVRIQ